MGQKQCSVCTAPADVRDAIEAKIRARTKYRSLAAESGVAKTILHRHATKHMPQLALERHLADRNIAADIACGRSRLLIHYETQTSYMDWYRWKIIDGEPLESDVIVEITYEQHASVKNPRAMMSNEEKIAYDAAKEKARFAADAIEDTPKN